MKVIKIGAIWCAPCLIMKPRWQKIEQANPWIKTEYFEYDDNPEIVEKYKIGDSVPVFIFLDKEGNELERLKGEVSEEKIFEFINKYKDK